MITVNKVELLDFIKKNVKLINLILICKSDVRDIDVLRIKKNDYFLETEVFSFFDKYIRINIILNDGLELKLRIESHDFAKVFMEEFTKYTKQYNIINDFYEDKMKVIHRKEDVQYFLNEFLSVIFEKEKGGYDIVIHC